MHKSISDMILDIVQNSIEANASDVFLSFVEDDYRAVIEIVVEDNGKGMSGATLKKVVDPFYTDGIKHKNRKVGLGLPFVKQTTELVGGSFDIASEEGVGTKVSFSLAKENIDTPPIGDIALTLLSCFNYPGDFNLRVNRTYISQNGDKSEYAVSKEELIEALGSLEDIESLGLLKQFLVSQEKSIK